MSVLCAVTHRKEDAARKWCPFAWTINNNAGSDSCSEFPCEENQPDPEQHPQNDEMAINRRCLTNRCMAWIDETDYFHGIALGRCGLLSLSRK